MFVPAVMFPLSTVRYLPLAELMKLYIAPSLIQDGLIYSYSNVNVGLNPLYVDSDE